MTGEGRPRRSPRRAWVPRFLEAMRATGNVRLSADAAGVDRSTPYKLAQRDPSFQAAWEAAEQDAIDVLEATARKRALSGSDSLCSSSCAACGPNATGPRSTCGSSSGPMLSASRRSSACRSRSSSSG